MIAMAEYTFYIPKEFLLGEVTAVQVSIAFIILLIILFFGYKFFKESGKRRRPESF